MQLLSPPFPVLAEPAAGRFFFSGDGLVHIRNLHTNKEARVRLLTPEGSLDEEGFTRIDEVFGLPTAEKGEHISPRLIFMLDHFSDLVAPGKPIDMISGYRSPEYNSALRDKGGNVAKTSIHQDGMALDFSIEGVKGKELWQLIKSRNCAGVGHYGGSSIHLDSAKPRYWEAATSKVRTGESDHNRRIYLSTDYDRYRAGDMVRLSFSSVSDFGFGIGSAATIVSDPKGENAVATAPIKSQDDSGCVMIRDRRASRFIYFALPPNLREGRYRIRVDFCTRPSDQMPRRTVSNEIELVGRLN
jgi:uncharacterized protein YcbK (DUF882 family)